MSFPEDTELASHYVKKAIPLMMKNGVAPNPCNFALWYVYVSNRDLELTHTLDKMLKERDMFSEEVCRDLFRKYIVKEEATLQENLQKSLESILLELSNNAEETKNGTDDFERSLEISLESISHVENSRSLESTIENLIKATKSVKSMTHGFQDQLVSARKEIIELRRQLDEKEQDINIDALTQIGNRRLFDKNMVEFFQKGSGNMTLVLIDLDHFKKINDIYGHLMGDKLLQNVGKIMQQIASDDIIPTRYGGEEFALQIENSLDAACHIAKTLRVSLSKITLRKKKSGEAVKNITASFGIAQRSEGEFPEQLIERADKALYSAKENGRDQIQVAT